MSPHTFDAHALQPKKRRKKPDVFDFLNRTVAVAGQREDRRGGATTGGTGGRKKRQKGAAGNKGSDGGSTASESVHAKILACHEEVWCMAPMPRRCSLSLGDFLPNFIQHSAMIPH